MKTVAVFVKNLTSGGAEKQSVLLAKALSRDYDVYYIIFNEAKVHKKYLEQLAEEGSIHIKSFKGNLFVRLTSLIVYLKRSPISTIFSYLTAANLYACMAGKMLGIKVFTGLRNAELPVLKCFVDRILTNYFSEMAISNSYSGKENFVRKGFKKEKIVVIPNCYDDIKPYSPKEVSTEIRIITVGRFVRQKDYKTAIKSISCLKEHCASIHYDIVGYGELQAQIEHWIDESQIKDITTVYLNPDNIAELLDKSHIYLSTSLFEGTSNSIMEAMNADLPIVATNVGDNNRLIINGYNGFLCPVADCWNIAKAIERLISDPSRRIEMGRNSKKLLQERYSVPIFKEEYERLLKPY